MSVSPVNKMRDYKRGYDDGLDTAVEVLRDAAAERAPEVVAQFAAKVRRSRRQVRAA